MSRGTPPERELSAQGMRIAIVATRWNAELVEQLLEGAQKALSQRKAAGVDVYRCAGVFELAPPSAGCWRTSRKPTKPPRGSRTSSSAESSRKGRRSTR